MTVETNLHRARERVEAERAAVTAKREALREFSARVRQQSPTGSRAESNGHAGGVATRAVTQGGDTLEVLRTAFDETVAGHTARDSVLPAIQQELGEEAALALAPTTNAAFTPQLQQELCSRTTARERELTATLSALDGECESLATHVETVDRLTAWLTDADETPLSDLGFDELRARHDRLDTFRTACADGLSDRQAWLAATTSEQGQVGVTHRSLVASLYEDFPVDYPVLTTLTRLCEVCEDAQRAVRDHLVRRA